MDLSNKALALILVVAMVVSLGGTFISLNKLGQIGVTGYATSDTGTTNITIQNDISIEFTVNNVNLGAGYTNDTDGGPTIEYCTFDTNGTDASSDTDCVGFDDGLSPFIITNIGNQDVNLNLSIDTVNSSFLGGTDPVFNWFVNESDEPGSCTGTVSPQVWQPVSNLTICDGSGFQYEGANDELALHIQVSVPQDATPGSRTATITAIAYQ